MLTEREVRRKTFTALEYIEYACDNIHSSHWWDAAKKDSRDYETCLGKRAHRINGFCDGWEGTTNAAHTLDTLGSLALGYTLMYLVGRTVRQRMNKQSGYPMPESMLERVLEARNLLEAYQEQEHKAVLKTLSMEF